MVDNLFFLESWFFVKHLVSWELYLASFGWLAIRRSIYMVDKYIYISWALPFWKLGATGKDSHGSWILMVLETFFLGHHRIH